MQELRLGHHGCNGSATFCGNISTQSVQQLSQTPDSRSQRPAWTSLTGVPDALDIYVNKRSHGGEH